jgi:predicted transcriptional regulator of viral defense system
VFALSASNFYDTAQNIGSYIQVPAKRNIKPRHSKAEQLKRLIRQRGLIRSREAEAAGIPRSYLSRMVANGEVERVGRGLYAAPGLEVTEHHALAEVAKRAPKAVVCLLSALRFHELTTEAPHEVWIAIGRKDRAPKLDYPPVRVSWLSEKLLTPGVETHEIEGVAVKVTCPARTVADCFKFRNTIGSSVAAEALRDFLHKHGKQRGELWEMAKLCRVTSVIRPYLEALG